MENRLLGRGAKIKMGITVRKWLQSKDEVWWWLGLRWEQWRQSKMNRCDLCTGSESRGLVLGNNCMDGVAVYLSEGYKVKVLAAQSCLTLCNPMDCSLCPWDSPGKYTGGGCHFLLQGIFLTQGSNPGLLHCRQILYCLSHWGRSILFLMEGGDLPTSKDPRKMNKPVKNRWLYDRKKSQGLDVSSARPRSEPFKKEGAGTVSKAAKMPRKVRIEKSMLDLAI